MTDQLGRLSKGSLETQPEEEGDFHKILSFSFTIKTFNWLSEELYKEEYELKAIRTGSDRRQDTGPYNSPVKSTLHLPSHFDD